MTTFLATDGAGSIAEVRVPVVYRPPLIFESDGLGTVGSGEPVEHVMSTLTELLGGACPSVAWLFAEDVTAIRDLGDCLGLPIGAPCA